MEPAGDRSAARDALAWPESGSPRGLRRTQRLRASADFQRVRALGRSWAHSLLVLYVAPNEVGHARIGISVNRRVGKAVLRNRVRRRIREAIRPALADLPGRDLLFIARAPAASADWAGLRGAAFELLRRARLMPSPAPASGR